MEEKNIKKIQEIQTQLTINRILSDFEKALNAGELPGASRTTLLKILEIINGAGNE